MAAEKNLIKKADLARAREVDFVYRFTDSIKKLVEALGVTRTIPKAAGTYLKAYKATGTLQDGLVAEGDIIPLSHYKTIPVNFGEIPFKKWRKATSAEAIIEKGYDQAVTMTTDEMLKDAQKGIKKYFFNFLSQGTGLAAGTTFQSTLAAIWGQLQVLYEDTEIAAVYFMNPLDVADYLGSTSGKDPNKMKIDLDIGKGEVLDVPVLNNSPVNFELEVTDFIYKHDGVTMLCKIRNVLQDESLSSDESVEEKLTRIAPVKTTAKTYLGYNGKALGAWGEPGKDLRR